MHVRQVLRDREAIAQAEMLRRQRRVRAMQEEYARHTLFVRRLAKNRTYEHVISEADKAALRQQVPPTPSPPSVHSSP